LDTDPEILNTCDSHSAEKKEKGGKGEGKRRRVSAARYTPWDLALLSHTSGQEREREEKKKKGKRKKKKKKHKPPTKKKKEGERGGRDKNTTGSRNEIDSPSSLTHEERKRRCGGNEDLSIFFCLCNSLYLPSFPAGGEKKREEGGEGKKGRATGRLIERSPFTLLLTKGEGKEGRKKGGNGRVKGVLSASISGFDCFFLFEIKRKKKKERGEKKKGKKKEREAH